MRGALLSILLKIADPMFRAPRTPMKGSKYSIRESSVTSSELSETIPYSSRSPSISPAY